MPKVSIIVPVYKVEQYIRECLDSIKQQTFTDWECLLIDDGSPDNSGKICDEYAQADARFKVFHVDNGGVSRARNIGLDNMSGEWVLFVDSDDYIAKDTLEVCVKESNRLKLDIYQFSYCRVLSSGQVLENYNTQIDVSTNEVYIKNKDVNYCIAASFIKSDVIDIFRFNPEIKLAEDQLFMMQVISRSKRICRSSKVLYYYLYNEASSSVNVNFGDIKDSLLAITEFKDGHKDFMSVIDSCFVQFIFQIANIKEYLGEEELRTLKCMYKKADIQLSRNMDSLKNLFIVISKLNFRFAFRILYLSFRLFPR